MPNLLCELETTDHLVFRCPFACAFQHVVGVAGTATGMLVGSLQDFDVRVAEGLSCLLNKEISRG